MKRVCLFAGYNVDKVIKPYVLDYILELNKFSDVYYLADGELNNGELDKLSSICKGAWVKKHGKYDFGSYSELLKNYVGWDIIESYEEVIFCNDSCLCVNDFSPVFSKMSGNFDCWGLLATDENNIQFFYKFDDYKNIPSSKVPLFCIGSYFLVFNKVSLFNKTIKEFFDSVKVEPNRLAVCLNYEMKLTSLLQQEKLSMGSYINQVYRNVAIYDLIAFKLVSDGFPLLKIKIFKDNPLSIPSNLFTKTFFDSHIRNCDITSYLEQINFNYDIHSSAIEIDHRCIYPRNLFIPSIFQNNTIKLAIAQILPPVILIGLVSLKKYFKRKVKPIARTIKSTPSSENLDLKETFLPKELRNVKVNMLSFDEEWVVYFNVARDLISGGMLSINRFVEKSLFIDESDNKKLILSTLPLANNVVSYTGFKSAKPAIHFNEIIKKGVPRSAILNVPENFVRSFIDEMDDEQKKWLHMVPNLRINILNQNNNYMPNRDYIEYLRSITTNITMTVAHVKYCTQDMANKYQIPVSLLTPFIPRFYRSSFLDKEKIIVLSPDNEAFNKNITRSMMIERLSSAFPEYSIITVKNMTLEEYKVLISKAMFTLTFGEGYDGYFIEPALSSSVSFSVFNPVFFPSNFKKLDNLYDTIEDMYNNIVSDMKKLSANQDMYEKISLATEAEIKRFTNDEISYENLTDFYENRVDYLPSVTNYVNYEIKTEAINNEC